MSKDLREACRIGHVLALVLNETTRLLPAGSPEREKLEELVLASQLRLGELASQRTKPSIVVANKLQDNV